MTDAKIVEAMRNIGYRTLNGRVRPIAYWCYLDEATEVCERLISEAIDQERQRILDGLNIRFDGSGSGFLMDAGPYLRDLPTNRSFGLALRALIKGEES